MPKLRHFRTAGPIERAGRNLHIAAMRRLGVRPHTTWAQGARFAVDTDDFVDTCIAQYGMWEDDQLERLAALASARRVDWFVDAGANTGFYSIMFAVKRLAGRIVAFEPDPGNFARLQTNLALNRLAGRIEAVPLALGDAASEVTLYEGARTNRGESTIAVPEQTPGQVRFQVRQARFDDLYRPAGEAIVVKMDVEGYEFHALAGMERTLRDNSCYVQVELYSDRLAELKALFHRFGYRYLHTCDIDHYFTNMPDIG